MTDPAVSMTDPGRLPTRHGAWSVMARPIMDGR
eukprot:CAMPEP_0181246114 /NCGR_PEP_ID=MMETSP1096-20121128/43826_1 /TAXON_ID=156174 ORGANISM="Chrysochromulina ericina, Strain CCMP281" /NCGR_SAMPLE_ID=MMETSP1096 /ASSEMBLY_ACC=CAM_ASM_000453 /LENGTH=32 /DNA_ID= /DNA_START= /DNA_END= /DNA_ORIENTATION=